MGCFRSFSWVLVLFCHFLPIQLQAGSTIYLIDTVQQNEGHMIDSFVTTDHGHTFIAAKSKDGPYQIMPRDMTGGQPVVQIKPGSVTSGLLAHNSGTDFDTLVLMTYHQADGYQLHIFTLKDRADGSGQEFTDEVLDIGRFAGGCTRSPRHLAISGGFQGKIAFASDCMVGEFDLGMRRLLWSQHTFHTVYAAIRPAIDSLGRAHFLVRPDAGESIHLIRSRCSDSYTTIAVFMYLASGGRPSQPPFNGMVILADDSVLLTGTKSHKRIAPEAMLNIVLPSFSFWGSDNAVNTREALYLPVVDSETGTQLSIRIIPFSANEQPFTQFQASLDTNSQHHPAAIGLIRDNSGMKLAYFANGDIFRQDIENINAPPDRSEVVGLRVATTSYELTSHLLNPASPLLAGKEAFVLGTRTLTQFETGEVVHSDTLYRLSEYDGNAPFTKNLRGFWAQPGADEQQSNSVPAGVEVFLRNDKFTRAQKASGSDQDDPVVRVTLKCHPVGDSDSALLIPADGLFLNSRQRLLSITHNVLLGDKNYPGFVAGMQCEPFTLDVGHTPVTGDSLGDSFLLQLVGVDPVPLWATNLPQVNGVLSSEVTETSACLQGQSQCWGYHRLVIGRTGGNRNNASQTTNRSQVIIDGVVTEVKDRHQPL